MTLCIQYGTKDTILFVDGMANVRIFVCMRVCVIQHGPCPLHIFPSIRRIRTTLSVGCVNSAGDNPTSLIKIKCSFSNVYLNTLHQLLVEQQNATFRVDGFLQTLFMCNANIYHALNGSLCGATG